MATYYLDPVDGNDANDGTTFANRWKTWTSGPTAARIAAGDTIRVIASPDPTSVGNATWTDNSRIITLASACTQTIDNGEIAWTASANVTSTASTLRKQGSFSTSLAIAAAFATGKIAYRSTGTLDLSAYQQVSFWIRPTSLAVAAGALELRLCSDTTGDVPVHAILLDQGLNSGAWRIVAKDFGAALNSAIQSVALYAITKPPATAIQIDNIIACKAPGASDSLTHLSLIGKNTAGEPEWYPIDSIDGTTVALGCDNTTNLSLSATVPRVYRGTTETVATYKLQPLDGINGQGSAPPFGSTSRVFQKSGTEANPITVSGGWNRTDMSTQTGDSWMTGSHFASSGLELAAQAYITLNHIGCAHFTSTPVTTGSARAGYNLQFAGFSACGALSFLGLNSFIADCGNVMHNGNPLIYTSNGGQIHKITARRVEGAMNVDGMRLAASTLGRIDAYVAKVDNNGSNGMSFVSNSGRVVVHGGQFSNNSTADLWTNACGDVVLINASLSSATPVTFNGDITSVIRLHNYNGNPNDHRIYCGNVYQIQTDTVTRHSASGTSWKLAPKSNVINSLCPVELPLLRRVLAANVTKTINVWTYRDNSGLTLGIKIRGGEIAGVDSDMVAIGSATGTWEQLSITITPTEAGVVELVGFAYGGINFNGWFDDITVT